MTQELIKPFTFQEYREYIENLWRSVDKRPYLLVRLPVETGMTVSEVVHLRKSQLEEKRSTDGRVYGTAYLTEGVKTLQLKDGSKRERRRYVVFNSDLYRRLIDYAYGHNSDYVFRRSRGRGDGCISRQQANDVLRSVDCPINFHQRRNNRVGGRHLFKEFLQAKLIPLGMYSEEVVRKLMGHTYRDSHERYGMVNIDLAFTMVEKAFVG